MLMSSLTAHGTVLNIGMICHKGLIIIYTYNLRIILLIDIFYINILFRNNYFLYINSN